MSESFSTGENEWIRALDNMYDGALFRTVRDLSTGVLRFDYVSATWEAITGVSTKETLDDSENVFMNIPSDDLNVLKQSIYESDENREKFFNEVRYIHPISKKLRWLQISSYTRQEEGKVISNGFIFDVTARKDAEKDLFVEKARLQALNDMPDGTLFRSARSVKTGILKFDYVSATWEKFTGVSAEDSIANTWNVFKNVPPEDLKILMQRIEQSFGPLLKFDVEVRYNHPVDNDQRWLHIWSYPRRDEEYTYSDGFIFDITERKNNEIELARYRENLEMLVKNRTEELSAANKELAAANEEFFAANEELSATNEELHKYEKHLEDLVEQRTAELLEAKEKAEESDRLKSAFLANTSHEIRTPLNAIVGFIGFINSENISQARRQEFIKVINTSCGQLVKVIDDIIDIAKIESGQMNIHPVSVNLNEMMHEMSLFLEASLQENNKEHISLIIDESGFIDDCNVNVDPVRLRQVIINIMSNAVKFTEKGYIRFGYRQLSSNMLEFVVEDTGIGISDCQREIIFERFRKAESGNNRNYGGSGLGLTISRSLITLMGGYMKVESNEGKGTSIFFTVQI